MFLSIFFNNVTIHEILWFSYDNSGHFNDTNNEKEEEYLLK